MIFFARLKHQTYISDSVLISANIILSGINYINRKLYASFLMYYLTYLDIYHLQNYVNKYRTIAKTIITAKQ